MLQDIFLNKNKFPTFYDILFVKLYSTAIWPDNMLNELTIESGVIILISLWCLNVFLNVTGC